METTTGSDTPTIKMNEQFDLTKVKKYVKYGITAEGNTLLAYRLPNNGWNQVIAGTQGHDNSFKLLANFVTLVTRGKHSCWQDLPNPPPPKYDYFKKNSQQNPETPRPVAPDTRGPLLDIFHTLLTYNWSDGVVHDYNDSCYSHYKHDYHCDKRHCGPPCHHKREEYSSLDPRPVLLACPHPFNGCFTRGPCRTP
ncbi:hypothetical protein JCM1840_000188 [Sporobolomyces johnsonii]